MVFFELLDIGFAYGGGFILGDLVSVAGLCV